MNPEQRKQFPKSSPMHEQDFLHKKDPKHASRKLLSKISSFSFDSGSDVGYKSSELSSSQSVDESTRSESISSERVSGTIKKQQSVRFDSGLGTDVFSPLSSESDIYYPIEDEAIIQKKEKVKEFKSDTRFIWKDIYDQDQDGDTMLHLAVVGARSDVIFPLIQEAPHPDFLDICNDLCQTPLHLATLTGKSNIVRRLVVAGATLNIQNSYGNTALHIASKNGDLDCVQAILQPLEQEEIDEALCPYNIYPEHCDLSQLINLKNYEGLTCIHLAAMGGFRKVLECLYDHGGNINDREGKSGKSALHFAVENANFELVQILVSKCHANILAKNYAGRSVIDAAWTLSKTNPQRSQIAILDFFKRFRVDKWESPSDTESSSSEEIPTTDSPSGTNLSTNSANNK